MYICINTHTCIYLYIHILYPIHGFVLLLVAGNCLGSCHCPGEFTPSLKLKRSVAEATWKELIDPLF